MRRLMPAYVAIPFSLLGLTTAALAADTSPLTQMDWLSGVWEAQALGGTIVEVFEPASNGEAISTLTLTVKGKITRYELRSTREQDGRIVFQEKAFGPGLQPGAPVADRALVSADATHVSFAGLTETRTGPNTMTTNIELHSPDGSTRAMAIQYTRTQVFSPPSP